MHAGAFSQRGTPLTYFQGRFYRGLHAIGSEDPRTIDMASTLGKSPNHHRQGSRPNSASSSSIVTVQRASSFTSRHGPHPPVSGLRSQSPTEANTIPTDLSRRTLTPEASKRRSSALYTRPDSGNGLRDGGVGNLNRWSQSTASSKSSATHNRRNSFSRRLSGSFGSFTGFANAPTASPNTTLAHRGRPSPKGSPQELPTMAPPPINPPPMLPPIVTLSSLSQAVDSADSPSTATATPATAEILSASTYTPTEPDYFGNRWQSKSPSQVTSGVKRSAPSATSRAIVPSPIIIDRSGRNGSPGPPESLYSPRTTARVRNTDRRRVSQNGHRRSRGVNGKGSGAADGESSASDHKDGAERPQKRKAPSQKAMLSKALEKAHHAVTLDQNSNFEGAMHAYQEACSLLRRVMTRSSGVEDRLKLDAVVSEAVREATLSSLLNLLSVIHTKPGSKNCAAMNYLIGSQTARRCRSALKSGILTIPTLSACRSLQMMMREMLVGT